MHRFLVKNHLHSRIDKSKKRAYKCSQLSSKTTREDTMAISVGFPTFKSLDDRNRVLQNGIFDKENNPMDTKYQHN